MLTIVGAITGVGSPLKSKRRTQTNSKCFVLLRPIATAIRSLGREGSLEVVGGLKQRVIGCCTLAIPATCTPQLKYAISGKHSLLASQPKVSCLALAIRSTIVC